MQNLCLTLRHRRTDRIRHTVVRGTEDLGDTYQVIRGDDATAAYEQNGDILWGGLHPKPMPVKLTRHRYRAIRRLTCR